VEHAGGGGQGDPGVLGDVAEAHGGHLVSFFRVVRETLSRSCQHNEATRRGGGVQTETSRKLAVARGRAPGLVGWSPRRRGSGCAGYRPRGGARRGRPRARTRAARRGPTPPRRGSRRRAPTARCARPAAGAHGWATRRTRGSW